MNRKLASLGAIAVITVFFLAACTRQLSPPLLAQPTSLPTRTPTSTPRSVEAVSLSLPAFTPTLSAPALIPTDTSTPSLPILGQHVVRQGETVFCIGRGYGVYPPAIIQANNLQTPDKLTLSQVLNIPAEQWLNPPPGPTCARQFNSPFASAALLFFQPQVNAALSTNTPTNTNAPLVNSTNTPTPQCTPPDYFDPILNRCRNPADNNTAVPPTAVPSPTLSPTSLTLPPPPPTPPTATSVP